MFCRKCGSILPENARFCNRCGAPVQTQPEQAVPIEVTQPEQAMPIEVMQPELFDATPLAFTRENGYAPFGADVEVQPAAQPEEKPRRKIWPVVVAAVLVLLFAGGITYAVMTLFGGTRESAAQTVSRRLEQTWYMVGQPSVEMTLHNGYGSVKQSTGIPIFDYTLAEFTYEVLDDGRISITTGSKTGEFDLTFSDDGTFVAFTPSLFGATDECWAASAQAAQTGSRGSYRSG